MTQDVTRYTGGSGPYGAPARRAGRAIAARQMDAQVRLAGSDADTDVTIGKIEDLTLATGAASTAVVRIAQAQRHLEQLAPDASARLAFLADDHMLGCADVLADLRRELRRR